MRKIRKRIGERQRALLDMLEQVGSIKWGDLESNERRGVSALERNGLVKFVYTSTPSANLVHVELATHEPCPVCGK